MLQGHTKEQDTKKWPTYERKTLVVLLLLNSFQNVQGRNEPNPRSFYFKLNK